MKQVVILLEAVKVGVKNNISWRTTMINDYKDEEFKKLCKKEININKKYLRELNKAIKILKVNF